MQKLLNRLSEFLGPDHALITPRIMISPSISVIVPSYNDGSILKNCLAALQQQDFSEPFEVIVVDNGSTHNQPTLPAGDHRFRLLREEKPGSYAARNRAVHAAQGQIVVFTDTDCRPLPNWLSSIHATFSTSPGVDLVAGHIELFFADPTHPTAVELYESIYAFRQEATVRKGHAVTANLAVRIHVFQQIGYFDDSTFSGGDTEFTQRATTQGLHLIYSPNAIVQHPARREFIELTGKIRRVNGGHMRLSDVDLRHKKIFSASSVLKLILSPGKCALRMTQLCIANELSPSQGLRVLAVFTVIRWYDACLRCAYRLRIKNDFARQ